MEGPLSRGGGKCWSTAGALLEGEKKNGTKSIGEKEEKGCGRRYQRRGGKEGAGELG